MVGGTDGMQEVRWQTDLYNSFIQQLQQKYYSTYLHEGIIVDVH